MHKPTNADYTALKRLLRYVQGTLHFGLPLSAGSLQLTAYSDADWASDSLDRKSITGFCIFLGKSLISWCVKKQITVAKSSTEAEYRALASATSDLIWLRRLLLDFHIQQPLPTPLYCDNTSALALALNPVFHARTKHLKLITNLSGSTLTTRKFQSNISAPLTNQLISSPNHYQFIDFKNFEPN
ncbi:putative mitochondrial protein [Dendrobium catenatum]|uniref:Putative mitochondrial protein n=1 Tax=Dendrobium catenatum TaxID=906689 RepID=A0A2I0VHE7_9ASPA|nr:putative mitochondrial protein [Dendrobium catenatum]